MHMAMLRLALGLALLSLVVGSECPSQQLCGDQQTCCQVQSTGEYNCCPFHQGECCQDHLHCCPEGMLCQTADSKCSNSTHSLPWTERIPAKQKNDYTSFRMISSSVVRKDNIVCPDNSSCPAEYSCLKLPDRFGCCPVMRSIVCADGKHCCPNDRECSADSTSCVKKKEPVRAVMCPDGVSECPMQTSCCETAEGGWGCCPMPKAVCCEDKVHCCPEDSVCHVNSSKCVTSSKQELPMWDKLPARRRAEWEDHKAVAATPKTSTKQPETTTVLTTTRPTTTTTTTTITTTTAATTATTTVSADVWRGSDVPCDDTVGCPDGTTCCKTAKGGWACCPLPQAVCCEDFLHCCPHGKKCNLTADTCDDPSGSTPWVKKIPSRPIRGKKPPVAEGSDVPCDDTVGCPDGTTCCKTAKGGWACCPLPQAVCCEDFLHCCPHGKKCNLTADTCDDPSGSTPWVKKIPSRPIRGPSDKVKAQNAPVNVSCDSSHSCPQSSSCCKDVDADWGCCPFTQGVCCEDHLHCCPHDYTCNFRTLTCDKGETSVQMAMIVQASQEEDEEEPKEDHGHGDVQCDKHNSCPDHTTCCFISKTKKWGCCPLPNAVCCQDGEHCCPAQYKCDPTQTSCIKGDVVIPWYTKVAAESSPDHSPDHSAVRCDSQTSCPASATCCRLGNGKWGCCPLPEATCCPDREHCCPKGYSCDEGSSSCVKSIVLQIETLPLTNIKQLHSDVQCGGGYTCKDPETCCETSESTWGCCPYEQAVCCSDMKHCCPAGYTCLDGGVCSQTKGFSWNHLQIFFSRKKRALLV